MDNRRFPIQGSCPNREPCNLWFCGGGGKGEHTSYGSVPWAAAEPAAREWHRQYGRLATWEQSMERMAQRGGFGHHEMDIYTGSREWFLQFEERKS